MSVRTDLEDKLITWAKAQSPVIKVALEGRAFDKPTDGSMFLQSFIMPAKSVNADVGGKRYRENGIWQINIWELDGRGVGRTEQLAQELINLFPVFPKFADTSIEQVGSIERADIVSGWRVTPVCFRYRRETNTN